MNILFVCTGNTCRSPMAEVYLKSLKPAWQVSSAGVQAQNGEPASSLAKFVVKEQGLDLSSHRSSTIDFELTGIDKILVMSKRHLESFEKGEAELLTSLVGREGAVADPYGGGLSDYQRAFEEIRKCIDAMVKVKV